jgi:hypothetical protein
MQKSKHKRRHRLQELTLVPLADMLTNTVGIILFILIFTVLTGISGVDFQQFSGEEPANKLEALNFICTKNQVIFADEDKFTDDFLQPLGARTYSNVFDWIKRFNQRQIENENFLIKGIGGLTETDSVFLIDLKLLVIPKSNNGETDSQLLSDSSVFKNILKNHSPEKYFLYFNISNSGGIEVFRTARNIAKQYNYKVGWFLIPSGDTLKIDLTKRGININ